MNVESIQNKAYRLTNTNSSTFLDGNSTNILEELNIQYGHRILDILRTRVDINASITQAKTDLISVTGLSEGDIGYEGEYPFPNDLLRPTRLEIKFDGTNWKKADIYDLNDNTKSEIQQSVVNGNFSTSNPFVRFERDSYFIRPMPTTSVTNGIRVWYEQRQTDLTTDSPTFEQNLHDILAYDLAEQEMIMHAEKYPSNVVAMFYRKKQEVEDRFFAFYKDRFKRNKTIKPKFENYK